MTERRYLTVLLDTQPNDYYVLRLLIARESDADTTYVSTQWDADGHLPVMALGFAQCKIRMQFGKGEDFLGEKRDPAKDRFYAHENVHVSDSELRDAERNIKFARTVDKANRSIIGDVDDRAAWTYIAMLSKALRIPASRIIVQIPGFNSEVYRGSECRYRVEESLATWRGLEAQV
jgi:hypothetical protein